MIQNKDPSPRVNLLVGKLKAAGYRITPQRLAIIGIVSESDQHLSVEQIYRQVQKDFPTTSLATVYNTLERLKEMDEVLVLPSSGGSRYDGRNPEPHPHLICTACGRIEDLEIDLRTTAELVAAERGYANVRHRLEFSGVCPSCQGDEPSK